MRKKCSRCQKSRLHKFFHKSTRSDGLQSYCINCRKIIDAENYQKHKKKIIARKTKQKTIRRQKFYDWKSEQGCQSCGENHPACLYLHHSDASTKEESVSEILNRGVSRDRLQKEIAKCTVLCSNCHRKLHWNEKNSPVV